MERCDALFIGGSAGALEVLLKVLPHLSGQLSFPVVLVLHRKPGKDSLLPELLRTRTKLRVKEAEEKEILSAGTLYIAPPDYHLLTEKDRTVSLDASEKVNFSRPSIDVSFESAAEVFENGLVCLLLSGANSDGTAGLKKVKEYGGRVLLQDPRTAVSEFMPKHAAAHVMADAVLAISEMAPFLNSLCKRISF